MLRAVLVVGLMVSGTSAFAQSDPAKCKLLSAALNQSSPAFRSLFNTLEDLDLSSATSQFAGEEAKAMRDLQEARLELLPRLEAFASKAEDAAYTMQKCAR